MTKSFAIKCSGTWHCFSFYVSFLCLAFHLCLLRKIPFTHFPLPGSHSKFERDELVFKSHHFNKNISEIFSLCFVMGMLLFICLKFGLGFLDVFPATQGEYLLVTSSNLCCLFSCKPHQ